MLMLQWNNWLVKIIGIGIVIISIVSLSVALINVPVWPMWTGLNGKTAWDSAELVIIPLSLAIVVFYLNKRQQENEWSPGPLYW